MTGVQPLASQLALFESADEPDDMSGFSVRESGRARRLSIKVYPRGRVEEPGIVPNLLSTAMRELATVLKIVRDHTREEADRFEVAGYVGRCGSGSGWNGTKRV